MLELRSGSTAACSWLAQMATRTLCLKANGYLSSRQVYSVGPRNLRTGQCLLLLALWFPRSKVLSHRPTQRRILGIPRLISAGGSAALAKLYLLL